MGRSLSSNTGDAIRSTGEVSLGGGVSLSEDECMRRRGAHGAGLYHHATHSSALHLLKDGRHLALIKCAKGFCSHIP
jgi:hypothetical protein